MRRPSTSVAVERLILFNSATHCHLLKFRWGATTCEFLSLADPYGSGGPRTAYEFWRSARVGQLTKRVAEGITSAKKRASWFVRFKEQSLVGHSRCLESR